MTTTSNATSALASPSNRQKSGTTVRAGNIPTKKGALTEFAKGEFVRQGQAPAPRPRGGITRYNRRDLA